jgi:hypothetical protein
VTIYATRPRRNLTSHPSRPRVIFSFVENLFVAAFRCAAAQSGRYAAEYMEIAIVKSTRIRTWLVISSVVVLLFTGCGLGSRKVKLDEEFTLRLGESVVVADTDLAIQLEGVGHQSSPNPQPQSLKSSYVELKVMSGGGRPRSISVDDNVDVGNYTITVKSANPFRSDDGPRCELVVTRR